MSEHSAEAERVDESAFGAGGESSIDADVAASGADGTDTGETSYDTDSADESVADSHASDVAVGYADSDDAPVQDKTGEDGRL
jgi:hypothetical protein